MRRFFYDGTLMDKGGVALDKEESHHISKVLRLKPGDEIELFDGTGRLYQAEIAEIGKRALVEMVSEIVMEPTLQVPLWVYQGDLKGGKMDQIVQKCTELGVHRFTSFVSDRSQGRVDSQRRKRRSDRWHKLMVGACKQCKRLRFMELGEELNFSALVSSSDLSDERVRKLICYENEEAQTLGSLNWSVENFSKVCLIVGPEGGFSREEIDLSKQYGWQPVSLGSLILRAETATLASVSITQFLLGNM